ncbi:MAG: glycosyltransferase family 4 protein [Candidatus Marinimicrobia bacterium]|jgi:glycosyltransferase involved in cell wall biosynthesis|nr:glycosyltransferase family 4 protein [Candidatus Neomarinimicrobiota bacterium]MDP7094857.1 glycosyltransferase family 4 protein [Candidatus Neomarinimicrobiota bacterium]MDP7165283.1 glycosyltransferase family 4 protein [Candidatus Neomarinimicrobiota bacterium]|tara:strand:+ start:74 stop:1225 length:1152 start_codon:yes stop_codon:yes gene_type:complete
MKIAILLLNQGRGSGVVAKEHGKYLLGQGHVVYYMHPNVGKGINGAYNKEVHLNKDIVPVHEYLPSAKGTQKAVSSMSYDEALGYVPAYENALEEIILETDIVIGHHANLTAIATANICNRYNKPYVLFLHGTGIEPRHHGLYDDKVWLLIEGAIKEANGIIVTTEYVRDKLVRNIIDLPLDRFLIQACGVNLTEFNSKNIEGIVKKYSLSAKYVICPGALTKSKGPQNVVEASKEYSDLAETIFIGDGELREQLEAQLGKKGRFLGFVPNEDKAKLINAATLLVAAPEKKEHFGIIYTEAMAGSVPIVAYEGGGVNSIVTPETGVLTKRSSKALGEAVRKLLLNEKRRYAMTRNCRERAIEFYSTEVLGPRLNQWLLMILNE